MTDEIKRIDEKPKKGRTVLSDTAATTAAPTAAPEKPDTKAGADNRTKPGSKNGTTGKAKPVSKAKPRGGSGGGAKTEKAEKTAKAAETAKSEKVANAANSKMQEMRKTVLRLAGTLFVITSVVALMLGGVNALTEKRIEQNAEERRIAAMAEVLPGYEAAGESWTDGVSTVTPMRLAEDGSEAWCVSLVTAGFGGDIEMSVAVEQVDGALVVKKVAIVSHAETMGDPTSEEFLGQYAGHPVGITLGSDENGIDAMTGATVSSKAITLGVNTALEAVQEALALGAFGENGGSEVQN